MNKRVFAILLAIAMIASSCALFASARLPGEVTYAQDKLVKDNYVTADGYKVHTVSVAKKSNPYVRSSSTEVNADNIDDLVSFKIDGASALYIDIAAYINVNGSIVFASNGVGTANIAFTATSENQKETVFLVIATAEIGAELTSSVVNTSKTEQRRRYDFPSDITVTNIKMNARLKVPSSATVDYKTDVTITATALGVPTAFKVAIYDGDKLLQKGDNKAVTYNAGKMQASKTFTVRIIDDDEYVQSNEDGKLEKQIEVTVKTGFFAKLKAFFLGMFGLLPKVVLEA